MSSPVEVLASFARAFKQDISNHDKQEWRDVVACGPTAGYIILHASRQLHHLTDDDDNATDHEDGHGHATASSDILPRAAMSLETLTCLANDYINSVHFKDVQPRWLRLFTDSSLLLSALDLFILLHPPAETNGDSSTGKVSERRQRAGDAVRRLDMALIVTGGLGEHRREWIGDLILAIQQAALPRLDSYSSPKNTKKDQDPSRKKARIMAEEQEFTLSPFARTHITVLPTTRAPPTMDEYLQKHVTTPFIVRDFFSSEESCIPPWPALHRWKSGKYLLDRVGEGRVVPVEIGGSYDDSDWGQKIVSFRTFLARSGFDVAPEQGDEDGSDIKQLYLAQHSLFDQFPKLEADFSIPDYVWSDPPAPSDDPSLYRPMSREQIPSVNVWIGNSEDHPVSPAHTDPHFNCYAQVLGSKRVWIAPPLAAKDMYAYGSDQESKEQDTVASNYMTNTSRVPIFRDAAVKKESFARFFENVYPLAQEAILRPGDLLVLPPGWWHAMKGEGTGPGWSVSMWY